LEGSCGWKSAAETLPRFCLRRALCDDAHASFLAGSEPRTLPRQMWSGMRESLSPTTTAVAMRLIVMSIALLAGVRWLQGRAARAAAVQQANGPPRRAVWSMAVVCRVGQRITTDRSAPAATNCRRAARTP
jgi:hypothetical protein